MKLNEKSIFVIKSAHSTAKINDLSSPSLDALGTIFNYKLYVGHSGKRRFRAHKMGGGGKRTKKKGPRDM